MKLLVTGAAGFIGSNFVGRKLSGTYQHHDRTSVTVLDKLTDAGVRENLDPVADMIRPVENRENAAWCGPLKGDR